MHRLRDEIRFRKFHKLYNDPSEKGRLLIDNCVGLSSAKHSLAGFAKLKV